MAAVASQTRPEPPRATERQQCVHVQRGPRSQDEWSGRPRNRRRSRHRRVPTVRECIRMGKRRLQGWVSRGQCGGPWRLSAVGGQTAGLPPSGTRWAARRAVMPVGHLTNRGWTVPEGAELACKHHKEAPQERAQAAVTQEPWRKSRQVHDSLKVLSVAAEEKHDHEVNGNPEYDNLCENCVKESGLSRHRRRVYSESCAFDCASVTFKKANEFVTVLTGRGPRCECFCRVVPRKGQRLNELDTFLAVMRARYPSPSEIRQ